MKRTALLFVAVLSLGTLAHAADSSKLEGWISDSMCGAKHAGAHTDCPKKCIEGMGAKPVFVDDAKKEVWKIDNPDAVKGHYGEKVTISATTDSDKKTVHIDSVTAAK